MVLFRVCICVYVNWHRDDLQSFKKVNTFLLCFFSGIGVGGGDREQTALKPHFIHPKADNMTPATCSHTWKAKPLIKKCYGLVNVAVLFFISSHPLPKQRAHTPPHPHSPPCSPDQRGEAWFLSSSGGWDPHTCASFAPASSCLLLSARRSLWERKGDHNLSLIHI